MKNLKIYCWPKNLRENQYNCAFFLSIGKKYHVYQFDIKGDKDKEYEFTKEEFEQHWEILSYIKYSKLISTQDNSHGYMNNFGMVTSHNKQPGTVNYYKDIAQICIKKHLILYQGKPIEFIKQGARNYHEPNSYAWHDGKQFVIELK